MSRRIAHFAVTRALLLEMFYLPEGTVITGLRENRFGDLDVTVESPTLPEVEGEEIPQVKPTYTKNVFKETEFVKWER